MPTFRTGVASTTLQQTSGFFLAVYNTGETVLFWLALPVRQTYAMQDMPTLLHDQS